MTLANFELFLLQNEVTVAVFSIFIMIIIFYQTIYFLEVPYKAYKIILSSYIASGVS
jgi:hypothetical protein